MTAAAPAASAIPTRDQVPLSDTWNLTALYPDDGAWEQDFLRAESAVAGLGSFKGRLAKTAKGLVSALEYHREFDQLIEKLNHYASLRVSEDSSNDASNGREARLMDLVTKAASASAYFSPELMAVPDEKWEKLLQAPALAPWQNSLRRIRRYKPHVLGEPEERLMALAGEPLGAASAAFGQLTDVDMTFGELTDAAGTVRELSQGSFSSFLVSPDRAVREKAFRQFYREFGEHKFTLAATLSHSVKSDVFQARARHHASAREGALFHDDVPVTVYDNLIGAVRANLPALHDYYELRREALKLPDIHHYDTYVPIVGSVKTDYTYEQASELVLKALEPLGAEYVSTLAAGLGAGRWCDRFENKGKRSGAFSSSSYGNPPFMLMNYKRDVFAEIYTLAHEAGHSMHTWLAQRQQPFQDYHYAIFVAEVASTFNEELLTHHLLASTDDRQMRAYILNRQIDDIRGTLFRQTMFAEFEKRIHDMQEAGEALTLQAFRSEYRKLLEAYFGPRFALDDELELECLRIPHFYSAFYVYKYATGISAALALSGKVLDGGDAARESYLRFLGTGGALMPLEALKVAGVDMTQPHAVNDALALFSRRVKELRELL